MRMIEEIRITRRHGRLHRVECLDALGNVLGQLPLAGVEQHERIDEAPTTKLLIHSARVKIEPRA